MFHGYQRVIPVTETIERPEELGVAAEIVRRVGVDEIERAGYAHCDRVRQSSLHHDAEFRGGPGDGFEIALRRVDGHRSPGAA